MKIWVLGTLFIVCFSVACGIKYRPDSPGVAGSGVVKTDSRNITGFTKIKAQNAIDLSVAVSNGYSIVIKADDNVLPSVITELQGDTLFISLKDKTDIKSKVNVSVTVPELTDVQLIGAVHATVTGVKADEFKLDATGASSADVSGRAKTVKIKAVGASSVNAEDLKADKADANAVGASKITVSAADELNADATGASSVMYVGEPKNVKQNATDVSTISKK
jgi:Putative auto-transporter adhesin, head GIN domain